MSADHAWFGFSIITSHPLRAVKSARSALKQSCLPLRNLIRMNIEPFFQFGNRLIALDCRECHFSLECR
jgi:hypothetical protein